MAPAYGAGDEPGGSTVDTLWEWFLVLMYWFFFFAYLVILWQIVGDLFRDRESSGWAKAGWVFFLIAVPYLAALVYLVARGKGMAERHAQAVQQVRAETDQYIRTVAGTSPAEQIATAKQLLDSGAIDAAEFAQLKSRALAA